MISVIIPVLNEESTIGRCIGILKAESKPLEIIVADGGSRDGTLAIASSYPDVTVVRSRTGRGIQMNAGAAAARGNILLFLHADTTLEYGWVAQIGDSMSDSSAVGGAFSFRIDNAAMKYRLVERWVQMRCYFCKLPYGDQAIFVRAEVFRQLGGYRDIPLMEDVELVQRLKRIGGMTMLQNKAVTSARRWARRGLIKTTAINQLLMLLYMSGVDPARLAKIYYR